MIDYKKAEQAKKLLDESGVDYVLAYLNEDGCAAGQVQGAVLKVADCIVALIKTVGESIRDKHGDKLAVAAVHDITMKALQLIYKDKDSKKE